MEILKKAKELGILIATSEEMKKLKESELKLEENEEARNLLEEYKALQVEMVQVFKAGESKEKMEEAKKKLMEKQVQINKCEITKEFFENKRTFDLLIKNINDILTHEIKGDEGCSGHDCSSCGGSCGH